eukprot:SAG11_NODE_147_length_14771_cov_3.279648_9_plen_79_part_00
MTVNLCSFEILFQPGAEWRAMTHRGNTIKKSMVPALISKFTEMRTTDELGSQESVLLSSINRPKTFTRLLGRGLQKCS